MSREISIIIDKIEKSEPTYKLYEEEFIERMYKFGSLLSIIKNKKINPTLFLSVLLKEENIRIMFMQYLEIEEFHIILHNILEYYPNLIRSKIIKKEYKKYVKRDNKLREKYI